MSFLPLLGRRLRGLPVMLTLVGLVLIITTTSVVPVSADPYHRSILTTGTHSSDRLLHVALQGRGGGAAVKKTQTLVKQTSKKVQSTIQQQVTLPSTTFQLSDHYDAIKGCLILTGLERVINKIFM